MAQEHFCTEHQVEWVKVGKMKSYAHIVKDSNGNEIKVNGRVVWCSEPVAKTTTATQASVVPATPTSTPNPSTDRVVNREDSIERQTAFKGVIELICAGKLELTHHIAQGALLWAKTRLPAAQMLEKAVPPTITQETKELFNTDISQREFKTGVDLANYYTHKKGTLKRFRELVGVENVNDIADMKKAIAATVKADGEIIK